MSQVSQQPEEWEKEWNKKFYSAGHCPGQICWTNPEPEQIESFISSLVAQVRKQEREKVFMEILEELKKVQFEPDYAIGIGYAIGTCERLNKLREE